MAKLITGSQIRVGLEYKVVNSGGYEQPAEGSPNYVIATGIGCLYQSGAFADVNIEFKQGWFTNYLTVSGITAFDFAAPEDIGGYIQEMLLSCMPNLQFTRRDDVVIDGIPQSAAGNPNVAQPNADLYTGAPNSQCNWESQKLTDYLACKMGVTPTTAIAIGVGLGLVGVILISKAAR